MQPLRDLVVIEIIQEEEKTVGGLYKAQAQWEKPKNTGKVLAKGPLVSSVDMNDIVTFNAYAVQDTEDKNVKLIREKDILCLVEQ